jgi:hypothetical protein
MPQKMPQRTNCCAAIVSCRPTAAFAVEKLKGSNPAMTGHLKLDVEVRSAEQNPGPKIDESLSSEDRQRRERSVLCLSSASKYSTHSGRSMNIPGRDPAPSPKPSFNRSQSSRVRLDLCVDMHSWIAFSRKGAILLSLAAWHLCRSSSNEASARSIDGPAARADKVSKHRQVLYISLGHSDLRRVKRKDQRRYEQGDQIGQQQLRAHQL